MCVCVCVCVGGNLINISPPCVCVSCGGQEPHQHQPGVCVCVWGGVGARNLINISPPCVCVGWGWGLSGGDGVEMLQENLNSHIEYITRGMGYRVR